MSKRNTNKVWSFLNKTESGCFLANIFLNVFLYKALTLKMEHLYSFHLAKLTYEIGLYTCEDKKCGHFIFVVTVIQIIPGLEMVLSIILYFHFFKNISELNFSKLKCIHYTIRNMSKGLI